MFSNFSGTFHAGRRPFTIGKPTNISNGFVWLNADLGNAANFGSALTDGAAVTTWKDVYAGSHDANKAGNASVKPVWKSNILNGYGVVRFDGVNDSLNINPVNNPQPDLQTATAYTFFAVVKQSSQSGNRHVASTDQNDIQLYWDGTHWVAQTNGLTGTSTDISGTSAFRIYTVFYNGAALTNATKLKLRINGINQTLTYSGTATTSLNATASYLYVGQNSASTSFFAGDIAEYILYARAFTNAEIDAEEKYLNSHWGLGLALG